MATVNLLLSSSPPRLAGCQVAAMSSSPAFPSPSTLVLKRPQLKAGSRAAPILAFSPSSATAARLPGSTTNGESTGTKTVKTKTSKKPKAVDKVVGGDETTVKKPRKPRTKKVDLDPDATVAPAEKPPRKPRAKKDVTESQSKLPKGRVTKASTGPRAEKGMSKGKAAVVSRHFASAAKDPVDPFDISTTSENDLLLQEAVKRRRSWTPPKSNADTLDMVITPAAKNGGASNLSTVSGDKQKIITGLFENFSYNNGSDTTVAERVIDHTGTKKRKLIELVITNNNNIERPIPKTKAVKKKPRTITELATSAYAIKVNDNDIPVSPPPLLQYFTYDDTPSDNVPRTTDGFKVPPKPRLKSTVKAASRASKAKKDIAPAPILLSPKTALKRVEMQQFVFGTSSQLAREDSPTLLRDLQQAMRISNEVEDDPFANIVESLSPSRSASATERGTEAYMAKRNLWAAASRGVEGKLMDIETVDMPESPQLLPLSKPSAAAPNKSGKPSDSIPTPEDDEWHDLDAEDGAAKNYSSQYKSLSSKVGPVEAAIRLELVSRLPKDNETRTPTASKETVPLSKPPAKPGMLHKQTSTVQKPDYGSYPTIKLAKEIASYHIKPVKGRDQMISLLEKCWEGKQLVAANNSQKALEAGTSTLQSNKPLVLRQTPKKQKKKASPIPEEIYDSDSPLTPSPPRRRTKVCTPPLPLQLSVSEDLDESLVISPTSQQLRLHKHITQAITTAPPSKDPKDPSWHEKILLYDPIVLEDLATWLNTGALEKVGWDGEVDPKEVKKWCLEKSICCLWRENLRGAARSRY